MPDSISCPDPTCTASAQIIDRWTLGRPPARSSTSRPAANAAIGSPRRWNRSASSPLPPQRPPSSRPCEAPCRWRHAGMEPAAPTGGAERHTQPVTGGIAWVDSARILLEDLRVSSRPRSSACATPSSPPTS